MQSSNFKLRIGGLHKFTLLDYPGELALIIFFQGCNLRCPWCYNPELVDPSKFIEPMDTKEVLKFLESRKGKLQVVLCGGEPLIQPGIIDFIKEIKSMDFKIKLDSNGTLPDVLEEILKQKLVDYIAVDIKLPFPDYERISSNQVASGNIVKTIELLKKSDTEYEFRTTLVPGFHNLEVMKNIAQSIKHTPKYFLQPFKPGKNLTEEYTKLRSFSSKEIQSLLETVQIYIPHAKLRSSDN